MRRNKDSLAFLIMTILAVICIWGLLRLTDVDEPVDAEPAFYKVYEDSYVSISLSYMDKNQVSSDGTTFVSVRGQSSNDILLIVENLKSEGLIFTPTPIVTIIDSRGEVVDNLTPLISVTGFANADDSTYISFTNPIPPANIKTGEYSYVIDFHYIYTFYDREDYSNDVSITINTEIRSQKMFIETINFIKQILPYAIISILLLIIAGKRRKRR